LFARYGIADDIKKKPYATSFATLFLKCDLADDWDALQEFLDVTKTYSDFKSCLFYLYNQNIPQYTLFDLEQVVSDQFQTVFQALQDLSQCHL